MIDMSISFPLIIHDVQALTTFVVMKSFSLHRTNHKRYEDNARFPWSREKRQSLTMDDVSGPLLGCGMPSS